MLKSSNYFIKDSRKKYVLNVLKGVKIIRINKKYFFKENSNLKREQIPKKFLKFGWLF